MMSHTSDVTLPMWQLHLDQDRVAWLEIDDPASSVNTLSSDAMKSLDERLNHLEGLNPKALAIISLKQSGFIAGANIKEFTSLHHCHQTYELIRYGQKVLDRLEQLPYPTVAAIHGYALGGGLELALACSYRIATSDIQTTLGLPEVQLGIHPGFGGTVRTVKLLGPIAAMELILSGKSIKSDKALDLGLIDQLTTFAQLREQAKRLALNPPPPSQPKFTKRIVNLSWLRPLIAYKLRRQIREHALPQHYPAPYAVIDLWKRYGAKGEAAYEAEASSIASLFSTSTSQNLVRVYLLQDRLKSLGSKSDATVTHVHVIGAGVMGGDIASWCAIKKMQVSLQDRGLALIQPALDRANKLFKNRYTDVSSRAEVTARLKPDIDGVQAGHADFVIEAIFENVNAKKELYSKLEPQLKPDAILATNTSSIVLEALATDLHDSGRFIGLHFFNPVSRMPLIEIVCSLETRPEVIERAINFARQLDKLPLVCRSAPGFVVNRILMPYINEAMRAVDEGIPIALIDKIACEFGMPMGPLELADVVGLDVCLHVGEILAEAYSRPQAKIIKALVDGKKTGKKSGQGFYVWQDGQPIRPKRSNYPIPEDLQDRLILSMINESMAVLRQNIVSDADLIDAAVIFGAGFAPFRGGPLHYAQCIGSEQIVSKLEGLAKQHGDHFKPDPGWKQAI